MAARGQFLLFADADGATLFSDIDALLDEIHKEGRMSQGTGVVIGSRKHLARAAVAKVCCANVL